MYDAQIKKINVKILIDALLDAYPIFITKGTIRVEDRYSDADLIDYINDYLLAFAPPKYNITECELEDKMEIIMIHLLKEMQMRISIQLIGITEKEREILNQLEIKIEYEHEDNPNLN